MNSFYLKEPCLPHRNWEGGRRENSQGDVKTREQSQGEKTIKGQRLREIHKQIGLVKHKMVLFETIGRKQATKRRVGRGMQHDTCNMYRYRPQQLASSPLFQLPIWSKNCQRAWHERLAWTKTHNRFYFWLITQEDENTTWGEEEANWSPQNKFEAELHHFFLKEQEQENNEKVMSWFTVIVTELGTL